MLCALHPTDLAMTEMLCRSCKARALTPFGIGVLTWWWPCAVAGRLSDPGAGVPGLPAEPGTPTPD